VPAPALEWRPAARADLLAIVDHVADDNPDAARRLQTEIEARVAQLPDHPRLYRRGRVPGTREMVVRTNYIVICSDNLHSIRILRVLHAARLWPPDRP